MRKIIKISAVFALSAMLAMPTFASELEGQIEEANNRQEELQAEVANSQARLEELQGSKADIEEKIAEIDAEIEQVDALIAQYSDEEVVKEGVIDELELQISDQEDELAAKYEKMKIRIKYMYENLDANYIEAIFSSTSFGEFFEKVEYISALNKYDRKMMDEIEILNKELKANKESVEEELEVVQALGAAQEEQKVVLDDLQVMKSGELSNTVAAITEEENEIYALNAMLEENAGQIAALSAEYDEWLANGGGGGGGEPDPEAEEAARQAEEEAERLRQEAEEAEEAARRAEEEAERLRQEIPAEPVEEVEPEELGELETDEYGNPIEVEPVETEAPEPQIVVDPEAEAEAERLRQEAEEKERQRQEAEEEAERRRQEAENSGGGDYGGEAGVPTGSWIWPLPGYTEISSGFGPRDGGYHYGIDIPAPEGAAVVAVDGGKVVMARWDAGADTGLYVVIYHGGTYSEYMHLSGIAVSEGQNVSQGEVIGYVGNTGQSYGAHLHFAASAGTRYWENRFAPPF